MNYFKKIFSFALPFVCIFCKNLSDRAQDLCQRCYDDLPRLAQGCLCCANVLPFAESLCGQCLQKKPPFDHTHALFSYQPPVTKLILDLKFQHALANAKLLGELLLEKIVQEWYQNKSLPSVIIPMPLHALRLKERGFNQALEIARPIARQLHLPLLTKGFVRQKHTIAQATLPADERRRNMRDAFLITSDIKNQTVAVIDDVITTGTTIHEFSRLLKKCGAGRVDIWCCARPGSMSLRT
jgi:ComF family protein